jgi:hypothetical protein
MVDDKRLDEFEGVIEAIQELNEALQRLLDALRAYGKEDTYSWRTHSKANTETADAP